MELSESIESINHQLVDLFGVDTVTGKSIWRISWSENQTEKRLVHTTKEGLLLLSPIMEEVKKYPYIKEKYVLERLVLVPEFQQNELSGIKQSYEPMWAFEDNKGNYLPPTLPAAKFIIDLVYAAMGKSDMVKYKQPQDNTPEEIENRIEQLETELFGDESGLYGKTFPSVGEGIVVPQTYKSTPES